MTAVEYISKNLINPNYSHIVEFGVWEGTTINLIKNSINSRYDSFNYKIFGFDSFEGLPEDWVNTPCHKVFFSTNGLIPNIEGVKFFKGWFEDTLPKYVKEADSIAFAHIDCDLYSSTKAVLHYIHPFLKPGSILLFDEWIYNWSPEFNDHEQKAFYEYVEEYDVKFEFVDPVPGLDTEEKVVRIIG